MSITNSITKTQHSFKKKKQKKQYFYNENIRKTWTLIAWQLCNTASSIENDQLPLIILKKKNNNLNKEEGRGH